MPKDLLLLPYPQQLHQIDGTLRLEDHRLILLQGDDLRGLRRVARRFQTFLLDHYQLDWEVSVSPYAPASQVGLRLALDPMQGDRQQGYKLQIAPHRIEIVAGDLTGIFYAICTLNQIVDQAGRTLPLVQIHDWPDFPVRGVMLDISRDKVPTMRTLYEIVDLLAGWKINQFQLYTEHTFAYLQHPSVWEQASPMTGQEIMDLDAYCQERFIELVPNQNSFGHLTHWLKLPSYQSLAEQPNEIEMPWGRADGAFSLCPVAPASLEWIAGLYDELLPHFSSLKLNVGCDETYDIGQGGSREAVEQKGAGQVYLDFLLKLYEETRRRNVQMMFWSDMIQRHPELLSRLPKDLIALEWGYEADFPFDEHCQRLAQAGIPFYVCPGTSSWSSLGGRTENALQNLKHAAEAGQRWGAAGYLITDWGDHGHWQPLPVSYVGYAAGAAFAWSLNANRELDVRRAVSLFAFRDRTGTMGQVAYALGCVYLAYPVIWPSSSILQGILERELDAIRKLKGIDYPGFYRVMDAIDAAMLPMGQNEMERLDGSWIQREFSLVARMLRHACRRGLLALETDKVAAADLCRFLEADMVEIEAEFQEVWLLRNRPGGLRDSLAKLNQTRRMYQIPGLLQAVQ